MAQGFLHGTETAEINIGGQPINVVKSGITALVGIAPIGPVNTLTLVTSPRSAAQFGPEVPGFSIPEALAAHFAENGGVVLVINVFSGTDNTTSVIAEPAIVAAGKLRLGAAPIGGLVLTDSAGVITLVSGTDYNADGFGNVTIKTRNIYLDGTTLKATYAKLNAASVTPAQIIGGIDSGTNARTGIALLEMAYSVFGFKAKILAAPHYSTNAGVAAALRSAAIKYRAICLLDAPNGTLYTAAISGRGTTAPLGGFATSSERAVLLYPNMRRTDPDGTPQAPEKLVPYSAVMTGVISNNDNVNGYWFSPSNKEMAGVTGVELALTSDYTDVNSETNLLNAAGIVTYYNSFGTGIRTWGNSSAAFPGSTVVAQFIAARRTADVIEESIEMAMLRFIDQPLSMAGLDVVRESINAFLRVLKGRGAIIDGVCLFLKEDNPAVQLLAGNATFSYDFMPPPPMQRVTLKATFNTGYLKQLVGG